MAEKVNFFILPGSPRQTIGLMMESLSSGNFSKLHDRYMAALSTTPENTPNDRNVFTFVSYESAQCSDNPKPGGITLGIFQCPSGKSYRRYGAVGRAVNLDRKSADIPVQDIDLFEYRVKDLLPILKQNGFTISDTYNLRPPVVSHFPDSSIEFIAEKPNQTVFMSYDTFFSANPPEALVQSFGIYVIEE